MENQQSALRRVETHYLWSPTPPTSQHPLHCQSFSITNYSLSGSPGSSFNISGPGESSEQRALVPPLSVPWLPPPSMHIPHQLTLTSYADLNIGGRTAQTPSMHIPRQLTLTPYSDLNIGGRTAQTPGADTHAGLIIEESPTPTNTRVRRRAGEEEDGRVEKRKRTRNENKARVSDWAETLEPGQRELINALKEKVEASKSYAAAVQQYALNIGGMVKPAYYVIKHWNTPNAWGIPSICSVRDALGSINFAIKKDGKKLSKMTRIRAVKGLGTIMLMDAVFLESFNELQGEGWEFECLSDVDE